MFTTHIGDCRDVLPTMASGSVHCVVTSPPYWGLRDYGTGMWEGGDPACGHKQEPSRFNGPKQTVAQVSGHASKAESHGRQSCQKCGAIRHDKQLGLEAVLDCLGWATKQECRECYICRMVAVFREVRRVLRDDATCWINCGDSYASGKEMKSKATPSYVDLAYVAGIIDGEGCIGIRHSHRDNRPTQYHDFSPFLTVAMNDVAVLEKCINVIGAGKITTKHRKEENRKPTFQFDLSGGAAIKVLSMVYPFLVGKKDQAKIVWRLWKSIEKTKCDIGKSVPEEEMNLRRDLWILAKKCNQREIQGVDLPDIPKDINRDILGKNLCIVPARLALALQADGWWLRQDIIWHKPNPMPESVTDRPTKAHEYIFLLSKSAKYFYDAESVKENSTMNPVDWNSNGTQKRDSHVRGEFGGKNADLGKEAFRAIAQTRNRRSVWTIPSAPFLGAHFAVFPPTLVKPCILAGTSARGCCPACGAPWKRVVKRVGGRDWRQDKMKQKGIVGELSGDGSYKRGQSETPLNDVKIATTVGWSPTCKCPVADPVPCTVLDPFAGSGTTGKVALELGRSAVLIELSPEYGKLIEQRTTTTLGMAL